MAEYCILNPGHRGLGKFVAEFYDPESKILIEYTFIGREFKPVIQTLKGKGAEKYDKLAEKSKHRGTAAINPGELEKIAKNLDDNRQRQEQLREEESDIIDDFNKTLFGYIDKL